MRRGRTRHAKLPCDSILIDVRAFPLMRQAKTRRSAALPPRLQRLGVSIWRLAVSSGESGASRAPSSMSGLCRYVLRIPMCNRRSADLSGSTGMLAGSEDRKSEVVLTQEASSYRGDHAVGEPRGGLGEACRPRGWSEPVTTGRRRTDTTRQKVTFERCLMDVNWPSRRGGLAIFVRDAAPSAREEYFALLLAYMIRSRTRSTKLEKRRFTEDDIVRAC